jgi:putative molybdopterin biosynthesis protein
MSTEPVRPIQSLEPLKLLGDATRLTILRRLMDEPATLSQLAQALGSYPAQIRHHLKQLEEAGLVKLVATHQVRGFVEKYYQASARAFSINLVILPDTASAQTLLAFGSHDHALELMAQVLRQRRNVPHFFPVPVGSLEGLIALHQGMCHLAGCHLLDAETGTYNIPYILHIFPGQKMRIVHLARRLQGLILPDRNPLNIRSIQDLARPDVRLANRQKGSGTRIWLDAALSKLGIPGDQIRGYDLELATHHAIAQTVAEGKADVGIGLFAAALEYKLGFIPVFEEAYDLVLPEEHAVLDIFQPIWELLNTADFQMGVQALGGYYPRQMGEMLTIG